MKIFLVSGYKVKLPAYTLIEVVVTMALLTTFSLLMFPLVGTTQRVGQKTTQRTLQLENELILFSKLPLWVERVRPPIWANPETTFSSDGNSLKVSYWDGNKNLSLTLTNSTTGFKVSAPGLDWKISGLKDVSLDWWEKDKRIIGFSLTWQQNKTMHLNLSWGSFIL